MIKFFKKYLIILLLFITSVGYSQISDNQKYKINQVINNINNYYTDSINGNEFTENIIRDFLKELDPHSIYMDKEEVEESNKRLLGSFNGIGITYDLMNDTIMILSTIPNGPSDKAGIIPGDRIIKVEDDIIAGKGVTSKQIKDYFLGKKGSKVMVAVKRKKEKKNLYFTIIRDKIPVYSIDAAYMVNDNIGYIRLAQFGAKTTAEFDKKIKELTKKGAKNIIVDLRNNGGGYLHTAISLVDKFLSKDKLIVYTEGLNSKKKIYKAFKKNELEKGRLVVLVDEGSASASEIFSGAMQDWDRGVIVGRRTYGKGLVQRPFSLNDGSIMRLTIARYYTPSGRCIQKPYGKDQSDYEQDIQHRLKHGELTNKDSISFPDSLKYYTRKSKRLVYGGGGIMPDIFVPIDTSIYPSFYKDWIMKGDVFKFVHYYVDLKREYFSTIFTDFERFDSLYTINDKTFIRMINYIEPKNKNTENLLKELQETETIQYHIKALIANDLWGENEYYKIINRQSDIFNEAISIINDKKKYRKILCN